jgi:hypothetical protein
MGMMGRRGVILLSQARMWKAKGRSRSRMRMRTLVLLLRAGARMIVASSAVGLLLAVPSLEAGEAGVELIERVKRVSGQKGLGRWSEVK